MQSALAKVPSPEVAILGRSRGQLATATQS
jgi:hypothetical protein